ncbi:MAG TPA: methyltransferase domain-containing protein [Ktedonobacteraceae bacterium]|nr:methyltransferase domain-containing protein [Ktedonobacteraceae bacterium]
MKSKRRALDVELFERWGSTYERSWMQRRLFDPVHSAVLQQAASRFKPASVLDIGCGSGRLLRKAHDFWPEAHLSGIDPAQNMLEVARHLTPGARFSIGFGEALPLEDASVDLAFSTISFHHWRDQAAGVREVARVLRPGGSFLLADFTFPTWLTWLYPRVHSAAQMRALFEQAGLDVQAQPGPVARLVRITIGTRASR